jgi:acetyltransferase-like isoleucine patch superfamily enzyme
VFKMPNLLGKILKGVDSSADGQIRKSLSLITTVFSVLRRIKLEQYDRVLPFSEYLTDRWEKAEICGFGKGTSVYDSVLVLGDVKVGCNSWIGPNALLDGSGGLVIGSNCSICANVQIYSHDTVKWAVSGGVDEYEYANTHIGNNCYIGPNAVIQKGVTVGDRAVIGANSFVNKNIPNDSRAWGSPVKIQCK